jgi:hypothetical protein
MQQLRARIRTKSAALQPFINVIPFTNVTSKIWQVHGRIKKKMNRTLLCTGHITHALKLNCRYGMLKTKAAQVCSFSFCIVIFWAVATNQWEFKKSGDKKWGSDLKGTCPHPFLPPVPSRQIQIWTVSFLHFPADSKQFCYLPKAEEVGTEVN